jgi:flagellar biosynthetic protein FlhB
MAEERTEQPTAKRLRDARKRGQIARSKDLHEAFQFGAAIAALTWAGSYMAARLSDQVAMGLKAAGDRAHQAVGPNDLSTLALEQGAALALIVSPVALAAVIGACAAVTVQGGWSISWEPLQIKPGKLSPINGLKRLVPSKAGLDLIRILAVAIVLAWVGTRIVWSVLDQTPAFGRLAPAEAAGAAWDALLRLLRQSLLVLAIVGSADYLLKRWQHRRSLRMTKQEVKDEHKMLEGNPEIKGRVRRVQREMVRRRMLAAVPKATVIITNPTHYAVALEYKRAAMQAPRVVAKGADHMAQKIKDVAREHGVPSVENVTLARALYANAEIDEPIPADLFEAVAEVLAYLIRLKQLTL